MPGFAHINTEADASLTASDAIAHAITGDAPAALQPTDAVVPA